MSLVPLNTGAQSESPERGDRLLQLLVEIANLAHIYSNTVNVFVDHGYGQLSLAVHSSRQGPVSIKVERLSADLEHEKEIIEISQSEAVALVCGFFGVSPEILLGVRKCSKSEESLADGTIAKLQA
jgi:hypothetical protein